MSLFDIFRKKEDTGSMTPEFLLSLSNSDLRDAISDMMMKESRRMEVSQCLELFSGARRTFYIASLYESEVSTGGLCRYLSGPGRSSARYVLDCLTEIHASQHAALLRKFLKDNNIDPSDMSQLEISNSWEFEERRKLYPFDQFDDKFEKLYEKESIEVRLMSYVRNNIKAFTSSN